MGKTIELSTGLIFKPTLRNRLDVVTNIGKDNWFETCRCLNSDPSSFEVIASAGTAGIEDIEKIVGKVDALILREALIKAWKARLKREDLPQELQDTIYKEIKSSSRRINL